MLGHSYNQHQHAAHAYQGQGHAAHAYQGQGGGWGGGLSFPPPPIAHVDNSAVPSQSNPEEEEEEEDSKPAAVQNNDKPPKQAQVDPFMPIPLSRSASKQERVEPQAQAKDSEIPDQNQKAE